MNLSVLILISASLLQDSACMWGSGKSAYSSRSEEFYDQDSDEGSAVRLKDFGPPETFLTVWDPNIDLKSADEPFLQPASFKYVPWYRQLFVDQSSFFDLEKSYIRIQNYLKLRKVQPNDLTFTLDRFEQFEIQCLDITGPVPEMYLTDMRKKCPYSQHRDVIFKDFPVDLLFEWSDAMTQLNIRQRESYLKERKQLKKQIKAKDATLHEKDLQLQKQREAHQQEIEAIKLQMQATDQRLHEMEDRLQEEIERNNALDSEIHRCQENIETHRNRAETNATLLKQAQLANSKCEAHLAKFKNQVIKSKAEFEALLADTDDRL